MLPGGKSIAFCQVIVDIAHEDVDRVFTYRVPEGMKLCPGMRVHVPFGRQRQVEGVVVGLSEDCDLPESRVKDVCGTLEDYPAVLPALLDLAKAFVCVEPPNPRALPAGELAALLQDACARREPIPVECADGFEDALRRAFDLAGEDGIVCACGSLYSVASVMEGLRSLKTMRC